MKTPTNEKRAARKSKAVAKKTAAKKAEKTSQRAPKAKADAAPEEPTATKKASRAKKAPKPAKKAAKPAGDGPRKSSKTALLIEMLKRAGGATLEEMCKKFGWKAHTTRALLSAGGSLTKKHGITVISEKVGDERRYSIKG